MTFSYKLTLYSGWLKMGRLSFSLMRVPHLGIAHMVRHTLIGKELHAEQGTSEHLYAPERSFP